MRKRKRGEKEIIIFKRNNAERAVIKTKVDMKQW